MRSQSLIVGVVSVVRVLPIDERSLAGVMRCTCGMEVVVVVLDNGRMDLEKRRSMAETVVENVQYTAAVFRLFGSCTCRVQDR